MAKQLIDFMFSPYRRQVLAVLFLHADEQFHVRELARLTGVSAGSLHRELRAMAEAGLLLREHQGNQVLYQVDKACSIYEELASIFRKTVGLAFVIRDALLPISAQIDLAFIFGSIAQGKERITSDIDVMVIGDASFEDVVQAIYSSQKTLHREVNPVVMSASAFNSKILQGDRFVSRILSEPKIFLVGGNDELGKLAAHRPA